MNRRRLLKTVIAAPAATALVAQQPPAQENKPSPTSPAQPAPNPQQPPSPLNRTPPPSTETPKLEISMPDEAGDGVQAFFNATQFAALTKLSDILMPKREETPGALEANVPQFLDFLIGQSPQERQQIYKAGLDALNAQARKRFNKPFSEVDTAQAETLLAPLKQPWTYEPPTDPLARFLQDAKRDVRNATVNSREFVASASASGRRGQAGVGQYWFPLD